MGSQAPEIVTNDLGGLVCGSVIQDQRLTMDSGCQGSDCARKYHVYIPNMVCEHFKNKASAEAAPSLQLPLVVVMHCFGCQAYTMIEKHQWKQIAETYNFVAAFPEGIERSWNAINCCGTAVQKNIDDVGFVRTVISKLVSTTMATKGNDNSTFVSPVAHYAAGWSNGGFFVTHAALKDPTLFRAVAPISGFVNLDQAYEQIKAAGTAEDTTDGEHPVAILMNHARDDPFVQFTGCCTNSTMPKCCCKISESPIAPQVCMPGTDFILRWATEKNGCGTSSDAMTTATTFQNPSDNKMVTCTTYNGNCKANTTLCIHESGGHFSTGSAIEQTLLSMGMGIGNFFAQDACSINGGSWSPSTRSCTCAAVIEQSKGNSVNPPLQPYCLPFQTSHQSREDRFGEESSSLLNDDTTSEVLQEEISSSEVVDVISVLVVASIVLVYRRYCRRSRAAGST